MKFGKTIYVDQDGVLYDSRTIRGTVFKTLKTTKSSHYENNGERTITVTKRIITYGIKSDIEPELKF